MIQELVYLLTLHRQ